MIERDRDRRALQRRAFERRLSREVGIFPIAWGIPGVSAAITTGTQVDSSIRTLSSVASVSADGCGRSAAIVSIWPFLLLCHLATKIW
jgi:hypothetical protein